jgi:chromate transporter
VKHREEERTERPERHPAGDGMQAGGRALSDGRGNSTGSERGSRTAPGGEDGSQAVSDGEGTGSKGGARKGRLRRLWSLFAAFFQIGLFTIGGGMAMIPLLERIVVDERHWLDKEEMLDCVALGQSLPGVVAVNLATYVGQRREGLAGAVAATLGVTLPSFLIIAAIVAFLGRIGDNPYVSGAFRGIKAAVCGLIALSCISLGRSSLHSVGAWILAAASFVLIIFVKLTAVWVILGGAVCGIILALSGKGGEAK